MQTRADTSSQSEFRLSGIQLADCKLNIPRDLHISDSDTSFIITPEGAEKIERLLRVENGRNSAQALSAFVDLLLDKDTFSIRNFEAGTISKILSKMILYDLQQSDESKLISLLSSNEKKVSQRSASILMYHEYGPAYKDPKIHLLCKLISGHRISDSASFTAIIERSFKDEKELSSITTLKDKTKADLENIFKCHSTDITELRAVESVSDLRSAVTKYIKIIERVAAEKTKRLSADVSPKKSKPQKIPKKELPPSQPASKAAVLNLDKVTKTVERLKPSPDLVVSQQPSTVANANLEQVRKAVEKYGSEHVDIIDGLKRKSAPPAESEIIVKLRKILENPSEWSNIAATEIASIAINFITRLTKNRDLSSEQQSKLAIHLEHIALRMNGQRRDDAILAALLEKNSESQNVLAAFYMLQLKEVCKISEVVSALEKLEYNKKTLASRFSLKVCKSALHLKRDNSELEKNMEALIQKLRLPFDLQDLKE